MTSFLDKLNGKLNGGGHARPAMARLHEMRVAEPPKMDTRAPEEEIMENQKLEVDVYQTPVEVIIYAQAAGVYPNEFDLTLDEENDVLVIRGTRQRPDETHRPLPGKEADGKFLQQECIWEPFYRKIILPVEVDVVKAEAVFKKGVLVITLPVLKVSEGRKLTVQEQLSVPPPPPKQ